ncbi:MAG: hypothetical protein F4X64_02995 [Chloroflexi bacterium]|nr:hypothetical protein [Chloroflexota bacterium]
MRALAPSVANLARRANAADLYEDLQAELLLAANIADQLDKLGEAGAPLPGTLCAQLRLLLQNLRAAIKTAEASKGKKRDRLAALLGRKT